jgi:hypothetical protein
MGFWIRIRVHVHFTQNETVIMGTPVTILSNICIVNPINMHPSKVKLFLCLTN